MIIKSHIRGGFRDSASYLKEQGENEKTRLVEMSDPHVQTLDEAFRAMWAISEGTKVKKPLHHVSINPMKEERLTKKQVLRICERLEEKYGYTHGDHQRVIVEHVKDGRQHFHVMWNRVSLKTGKPHYPYMHKMQSKIAAREMEKELGLKSPVSRKGTAHGSLKSGHSTSRTTTLRSRVVNLGRQAPFHVLASHRPSTREQVAIESNLFSPIVPTQRSLSGMCEEQRTDFIAACDGKITWRQYFQKWGAASGNTELTV